MFKALMVHGKGAAAAPSLVELDDADLPEGEVTVRVQYSSLNYKDALAITGRGAILKSFPMIPGIDLAGVVEASRDAAWQPGARRVFCVRPPWRFSPSPQPLTTTASPGCQAASRLASTTPARSMPGIIGKDFRIAPRPVIASASL